MSIATEISLRTYTGVQADVPISVDIPVLAQADVKVRDDVTGVLMTYAEDYTVELSEDFNTFTLTPNLNLIEKLNDSKTLRVQRDVDFKTDATPALSSRSSFISREFERAVMRDQQLDRVLKEVTYAYPTGPELNNSLLFGGSTEGTLNSVDMGEASVRAGRIVGFDLGGSLKTISLGDLSGGVVNISSLTPLLDTSAQIANYSSGANAVVVLGSVQAGDGGGGIFVSDGTTGHELDVVDGVSSVITDDGRKMVREPLVPANATNEELRAALSAARQGASGAYLEHFLDDAGITSPSDWTQAAQAVSDSLIGTGGKVILPARDVVFNGAVTIKGMGVGWDGIVAAMLGDFANDEQWRGARIFCEDGVDWGVDPDSGEALSPITVQLDRSVFPASAQADIRGRGWNKLENFSMFFPNSGPVAAIRNLGTMWFQPEGLIFVECWDGMKIGSDPALQTGPKTPNNLRARNLLFQSSRNRPFDIVGVDGDMKNVQFGGNVQAALFSSCANFSAKNLRGWNTSGAEILRLSNCVRSDFGGIMYDGEQAGIIMTGDCDVHFDDMIVKGCNRSGFDETEPLKSSLVHCAATTDRLSGTLKLDGKDGYPPFTSNLAHYGLHAEGTGTDTRGLDVFADSCITQNLRVYGADARSGSRNVVVDENPKSLFNAGKEDAVIEVYVNHVSTSGQVNAASAVVICDTTSPVIHRAESSGAAGFSIVVSGTTVSVVSTSTTDRTSRASWRRIN